MQQVQTSEALSPAMADELIKRRKQPTSQNVDIINDARATVEDSHRQREAIQAFHTLNIRELRDGYAEREAHRMRQVEMLQQQILDVQRASENDGEDMRGRVRAIEGSCGEQIAALDRRIQAYERLVSDLAK